MLLLNGFVDTFKVFNDVVHACNGKTLSPDYGEKIKRFRISYRRLKISITPTVHAVIFHISEFSELVKMGLGPWIEQTFIQSTDHEDYAQGLLDAITNYNSQHLALRTFAYTTKSSFKHIM